MNDILIISNDSAYTYNFRKELIEKLILKGYQVYLITNYSEKVSALESLGIKLIESKIDRRGINPFKDILLLIHYIRIIKKINPKFILTFTTKPNIYGGIAAAFQKVKYLTNITGLGVALEKKGILQLILINLYKFSMRRVSAIFFQNLENMNFFLSNKIKGDNFILLPGSGVNTSFFRYLDYPKDDKINFLFIGRIMKEKGIDYYLNAAKVIRQTNKNVFFHILGPYEGNYKKLFDELHSKKIIIYHGKSKDVRKFLSFTHCLVNPTYYAEGMSNVLLEASSSGRPIIASNRSGCKEIIEDHKNGYLFESKNVEDLIEKLKKFIKLKHNEKIKMGIFGREKVIREFERKIVVKKYLDEIKRIEVQK